jgi:hypothetical protein
MISERHSNEPESVKCRITTNQFHQDCVSPKYTSCLDFLRIGCGIHSTAATLPSGFRARLLKNQKRPMVLIRGNYVRLLANELETIPRRVLLD